MLKENTVIFWVNGSIEIFNNPNKERSTINNVPERLLGYLCVDVHFNKNELDGRYGLFVKGVQNTMWVPEPYYKFPAEFKAALCLLGVE